MPEQGNTTDPVTADAPVATAVATRPQKAPAKNPPAQLPPYRVLLHNDDKNEMAFVIQSIVELTPLNRQDAMNRMLEAHESGVALLLVTHKERAELYQEQFKSKGLVVTIEPQA
jgi:ATP-dependent Clp protease adaptor protein ClpS